MKPTRPLHLFIAALVVAFALFGNGCSTSTKRTPAATRFAEPLNVVPARILGHHFLVQMNDGKYGPWNFLIDTGSSSTLVSSAFARRHSIDQPATRKAPVRVRSASGRDTLLSTTVIRRIQIGDTAFDYAPALVYDFAELSAHLGVRIDGILGFPIFRETILTLDYPQSRLVLTPADALARPLIPGTALPFATTKPVPLIPIQIGERTILALIDSGSDGPLQINPFGLELSWEKPTRPGATIGTISGDRQQQIGRLALPLQIGPYSLANPIADLTDQLSCLGAEVLQHFTISFDQRRGTVVFHRPSTAAIATPPRRSSGLSFAKTPAYWRVISAIPGSPAADAGLRPGDIVGRVNGEPVEAWNLQRFRELVATAESIEFTLIEGAKERAVTLATFELVP